MRVIATVITVVCLGFIIVQQASAQTATPLSQVEAQIHRSSSALRFFHRHHWMLAARHARCNSVPWTRTCVIARRQVHKQAALLQTATSRWHSPEVVREWVLAYHPCLDQIIQLEDRTYDPTVNYGGGHGNVSVAYGLPQATPGTKMASAGADWRTNPYTQLAWMISYTTARFGSECAAAHARIYQGTY